MLLAFRCLNKVLVISKLLQIPNFEFQKLFLVIRTIFSQCRSEQFWKQNMYHIFLCSCSFLYPLSNNILFHLTYKPVLNALNKATCVCCHIIAKQPLFYLLCAARYESIVKKRQTTFDFFIRLQNVLQSFHALFK